MGRGKQSSSSVLYGEVERVPGRPKMTSTDRDRAMVREAWARDNPVKYLRILIKLFGDELAQELRQQARQEYLTENEVANGEMITVDLNDVLVYSSTERKLSDYSIGAKFQVRHYTTDGQITSMSDGTGVHMDAELFFADTWLKREQVVSEIDAVL